MRKTLIAGNWKMNTTLGSAKELIRGIQQDLPAATNAEILVCPPAIYLQPVSEWISDSPVTLGAQNVYHESGGAFTGELSVEMLLDVGCSYVILGHSERRHIMGETDQQVNLSAAASLAAGLTPIICLGETLEQRENGETLRVVQSQFEASFANFDADQVSSCVIAYEPVWAIGTGKVATPEQAQEVHADLRNLIKNQYNSTVSESVRILYGGSVKPDNAAELLGREDIDGALVGGASLQPESFIGIITACN